MTFCCLRCPYETKQKAHLIKHLNSKTPCVVSDGKEDIDRNVLIKQLSEKKYNEKTYDCKWCSKPFNHNTNRSQHYKICPKNPLLISDDSDEKDASDEEIHEMDYVPKSTYLELEKKYQILQQEVERKKMTPQIENPATEVAQQQPQPEDSIKVIRRNRLLVWNKDFGELIAYGDCPCCSSTITQQNFEVGHIIASAKGGTNNLLNLRAVCRKCNSLMHTTNMDDFIDEMKDYRDIMKSKKEKSKS